MKEKAKPTTLQSAIRYFSDEQTCIDTVAALRWPDGVECVACGHKEHYYLKTQKRWKCKDCGRQFSVKLNTIFEDSPISLDKWLVAIWMLANCKNGVSSYELSRTLGVTQKSSWFMLHRIRLAMQQGSINKVGGSGGEVECDETFVGGRLINMHHDKKVRYVKRGGAHGKTVVFGALDRSTRKLRAAVLPNVRRDTIQAAVLNHVSPNARLYSDNFSGYDKVKESGFVHEVVNHATEYVKGRVHTNGIENFWSLLKRGLHGTYVAVEPFHLGRYVDEQVFRYNHRKDEQGNKIGDAERFSIALSQIAGKRLTFAEVTGKVGETSF
jgi:transposase-like protein